MKLRNIGISGFFKLILIIEYAIAIILLPVLLILYFVSDQKPNFKIDKTFEPDLFGVSLNLGELELLPAILVGFFSLLIVTFLKSWFLYLICKFTPFGKIQITSDRG